MHVKGNTQSPGEKDTASLVHVEWFMYENVVNIHNIGSEKAI
jgi:hypothetical protein